MSDKKKVIEALSCRATDNRDCEGCIYREKIINRYGCNYNQICADALELLKEQENLESRHRILVEEFDDLLASLKDKPHLMTVEELDALPPGAVVWEEYLDMEWEIKRTELDPVMKTDDGNLIGTNGYTTIMEGMGDPDVDGNAWRWWSAKPTEEQRKAAKWT